MRHRSGYHYAWKFHCLNQSIYQLMSAQNSTLIKLSLIHDAICYIPFIPIINLHNGIPSNPQRSTWRSERSSLSVSAQRSPSASSLKSYLILYPETRAQAPSRKSITTKWTQLSNHSVSFCDSTRNDNAKTRSILLSYLQQ